MTRRSRRAVATLQIFTHADCDDEIARYVEALQDQAALYEIDVEVIDLAADPLQAVKARIHSVPTAILRQDGADADVRMGTAPEPFTQRWLKSVQG